MVFTVSFVLFPAIGLFVTVAGHDAKASSPTWHQRRDARTTRLRRPSSMRSSSRTESVHRVPHPTFVTTAKRPSFRARDAMEKATDLRKARSEIFLRSELDYPNQLEIVQQIGLLAQRHYIGKPLTQEGRDPSCSMSGLAKARRLHAVAFKGPAAGARQSVAVLQKALLHGPIVAEITPAKMRSVLHQRRARRFPNAGCPAWIAGHDSHAAFRPSEHVAIR
jgi:hypothetical protein